MAATAILKSFLKILEVLECITDYQSQMGNTGRELNKIANKLHELEFVFMLNFVFLLHPLITPRYVCSIIVRLTPTF